MKAKSQKIGALEKVSFFLANVGNIPLMSLLSSFFTLFYTTIVGLDPAALGTLFLISKVADGISDPIMGYFLDNGKIPTYVDPWHGDLRNQLHFPVVWCGMESRWKICDRIHHIPPAWVDL